MRAEKNKDIKPYEKCGVHKQEILVGEELYLLTYFLIDECC